MLMQSLVIKVKIASFYRLSGREAAVATASDYADLGPYGARKVIEHLSCGSLLLVELKRIWRSVAPIPRGTRGGRPG